MDNAFISVKEASLQSGYTLTNGNDFPGIAGGDWREQQAHSSALM